MSLCDRDRPQAKKSPSPGIQKSFRAFSESRDTFRRVNLSILDQSGVLGSSKLPRRANTEIRPKKLNREAGYGITAVEELSGVQNLISEDIIVVVMGPTGTGKSTFIQKATDRSWNVGHSLQSHTSEVKAIRVLFSDGISLVLVDTPGFDDTNKSDLDILKIIAKWFEDVYRHDLEISGVLYLHRITDNRMGGTPQKNLKLFKKLCGARFFELVILMTTMWPENEEEDEEIFCNRELQLQKEYWADTIRNPEQIQRFRGTRASAWHILEVLFSLASVCQHRKILEIQQELVDLSKRVPDTNAGRQLQGIIGELVVRQSDLMKRLQEELSKTSDPDILRALILELNDLLKQRNQAQKDLRQMGPTVIERVHQIEKLFSQWMDRLENSLKTRARRLDEKLRKHASQLVQLASPRLGALYHGFGRVLRQPFCGFARNTGRKTVVRG